MLTFKKKDRGLLAATLYLATLQSLRSCIKHFYRAILIVLFSGKKRFDAVMHRRDPETSSSLAPPGPVNPERN